MTDAASGQRSNVLVLIGTRPEAIKMFPVVHALQRSTWFAPVVVTTGQHRDLVQPILDLAGIEPDFDLDVGHPGLTLNALVSTVIARLDAFCRERFDATGAAVATREQIRENGFPVAALVHGDTSSATAAAVAAFNLRIPVGHVEAGLRTWTTLTPFPEELNRQLISRVAAFHLAPTSISRQNLVREGIPDEQIFVTGNTCIDALLYAAALDVPYEDDAVAAVVGSGEPYVVVTAHRRENWNGGLARIAEAIGRLATSQPACRFILPLHPNPLVRHELGEPLAGRANVILTEPQRIRPVRALDGEGERRSITDSGGIQEEAPALGVPVLVARESTERSEGVVAGHVDARRHRSRPDRGRDRGRAGQPAGAHRDPRRQPVRGRSRRRAHRRSARVSRRHRACADSFRARLLAQGGAGSGGLPIRDALLSGRRTWYPARSE